VIVLDSELRLGLWLDPLGGTLGFGLVSPGPGVLGSALLGLGLEFVLGRRWGTGNAGPSTSENDARLLPSIGELWGDVFDAQGSGEEEDRKGPV
jgi:hypothetical protein